MADDFVDVEDALELNGYLKGISTRVLSLKEIIESLEASGTKMDDDIGYQKKKVFAELSGMKDEVREIKESIRDAQRGIIAIISDLKESVKADDMKRFERRIDTWAPESMVTHKEAQKVVDSTVVSKFK